MAKSTTIIRCQRLKNLMEPARREHQIRQAQERFQEEADILRALEGALEDKLPKEGRRLAPDLYPSSSPGLFSTGPSGFPGQGLACLSGTSGQRSKGSSGSPGLQSAGLSGSPGLMPKGPSGLPEQSETSSIGLRGQTLKRYCSEVHEKIVSRVSMSTYECVHPFLEWQRIRFRIRPEGRGRLINRKGGKEEHLRLVHSSSSKRSSSCIEFCTKVSKMFPHGSGIVSRLRRRIFCSTGDIQQEPCLGVYRSSNRITEKNGSLNSLDEKVCKAKSENTG